MVKNLKKLREEHGLSQQRLAELLDVTQQAVYKYEKTSIEPDIDTLIAMADILHTTVDFLIGRDKSEAPSLDLTADEASCIKSLRKQPLKVRENFYRLADSLTQSRKN
ncbi:MAG: helix-turn-helix transcriptional regulator [Ruminiclostridium sp.]|nr:helix-turn-helix transcriptional regulator [Ruminiclostridium sp.]